MRIDAGDGAAPAETTLAYLSPIGSVNTQTLLARAVLPNPDGSLAAGPLRDAPRSRSASSRGRRSRSPSSALQRLRDWDVVFVAEGDVFEAQPVELGRRDGDARRDRRRASRPGQRYVAAGSFILKAEAGKSGASHDH